MITSVFFNPYLNKNEQALLDGLMVEAIKQSGIDCYYILRNINNFDQLYLTDDQSSYTVAILIDVYLKSVMGFAGDKEFMSKFAGLEIRDQVVFTMARTTFVNDIGNDYNLNRPREGDLLYFPFPQDQRCFQIKKVNEDEIFYQLGAMTTWELTCELFEYSDEVFNTGIPDIDALQKNTSTNILDYAIRDTNGFSIMTETGDYLVADGYNIQVIDPIVDNNEVQARMVSDTSWSEVDPFSEDGTTNKEF